MTVEWVGVPNGARTWKRIPDGAQWRYDRMGNITAWEHDGRALPIRAGEWHEKAKRLFALHARDLIEAGANYFELRALLAIMQQESSGVLPSWGDCRDENNKVVRCGSPGADAPRSVGFYQITRPTAQTLGVNFDRLAHDAQLNHQAGLKLVRFHHKRHHGDFPTLATLWNAGSIRRDPNNPWGVRLWSTRLLTRYVSSWNALAPVIGHPRGGSELDDIVLPVLGLSLLAYMGGLL